jgi:aspartyl-tRNA(Asn)/glutamyl-tRNA(Gln) amidotransferase subunit A
LAELPLAGLRFGAPTNFVRDGMDETVGRAFERALKRLSDGGARIVEFAMAELDEQAAVNSAGGFAAAESWAWHRGLIAAKGDAYDPRVLVRIKRGEAIGAADYIDLIERRADLVARASATTAAFDALLMPTVPIVPPTVAALAADDAYGRTNMLSLRNCAAFNFLDRCAASLPMQAPGELPSGLMLVGERMGDRKLLAAAQTVESALSR